MQESGALGVTYPYRRIIRMNQWSVPEVNRGSLVTLRLEN